tara:strand:- start:3016 stop:3909 length:894 start_codon:yes stop_codon:yes gene_type:complete
MSYLKINKHKYWDSMADTGFGDRIKTWSYAYEINKLNNFCFTILVDDFEWRETQYLNFPYTQSEKDINTDDCFEINSSKLDTSKNYLIDSNVGIDKSLIQKITLKDKSLETRIKNLVKDRIGIHIRHWPILRDDKNHNSTIERFNYTDKMKKLIEVLDKYNSKFYISSDVSYDKPPFLPCLPIFRKKGHWLSEIYEKYDILDYRDIIQINKNFPLAVNDNKNEKWIPIYDEELSLNDVKVLTKSENNFDVVNIDDIYNLKIKRDIVDLFSLIFSRKFIPSIETGIESSWSEFVENYR